jgi:hypothetical protein
VVFCCVLLYFYLRRTPRQMRSVECSRLILVLLLPTFDVWHGMMEIIIGADLVFFTEPAPCPPSRWFGWRVENVSSKGSSSSGILSNLDTKTMISRNFKLFVKRLVGTCGVYFFVSVGIPIGLNYSQ